MASPATVTQFKRIDKTNDTEPLMFNVFDIPEQSFESLLERRVNNRLTFLSIVKNALTEGVDYCNLPIKGKKSTLPTLLKGGGEVVCQILGLTPQIEIAESSDQAIVIRCELHNEHQQPISVGFGARTYALDASNGGKNKTIKMATKSAYLDSVIRAGALSSLFTLDLEDTSDNSKTVELISASQVQHLTKIVNEYQLDMTRFINWLSKFSQSHKGSAINELNQLPVSLLNSVIEKIPTLATSAK